MREYAVSVGALDLRLSTDWATWGDLVDAGFDPMAIAREATRENTEEGYHSEIDLGLRACVQILAVGAKSQGVTVDEIGRAAMRFGAVQTMQVVGEYFTRLLASDEQVAGFDKGADPKKK